MRSKVHCQNDCPKKYSSVDGKLQGQGQLSGFVDTRDQKSRAVEIAKGVEA